MKFTPELDKLLSESELELEKCKELILNPEERLDEILESALRRGEFGTVTLIERKRKFMEKRNEN